MSNIKFYLDFMGTTQKDIQNDAGELALVSYLIVIVTSRAILQILHNKFPQNIIYWILIGPVDKTSISRHNVRII